MDKNFKQKVKEFFKKEGFFVVLFICLCVVTMVAAITIKKANVEDSPSIESEQNELTVNSDDKPNETAPTNAENVNNDKDTTKTVSNNKVIFTKPVEGVISRAYNQALAKNGKDNFANRVKFYGINIEAKVGTPVNAATDGIVEFAGKSKEVKDGWSVSIKHSNGLITKYCNLDEKLQVKKDDKVNSSTVIGKVGKRSALIDESFGDYLNLQMWNNDVEVNPTSYFPNYSVKK